MIFVFIIITFILLVDTSIGKLTEVKEHTKFENCMKNILSTEFATDVIMFYGLMSFDYTDLSPKNSILLFTGLRENVSVTDDQVIKVRNVSYNQRVSVIFFVRTDVDRAILFRMLSTRRFYKGKFLVILDNYVGNKEILMHDVVRVSRNNGVINVAFGNRERKTGMQEMDFFSWFPFEYQNR